MRVNIYSQELITEAQELPSMDLIGQQRADTGVIYSAVRLYLHSAPQLHQTNEDDDRSAITFWLPKSLDRREYVAQCFELMAKLIREAPPETGLDS